MTRSISRVVLAVFLAAATLAGSSGVNIALALDNGTPYLSAPQYTSATAGTAVVFESSYAALPSSASMQCGLLIGTSETSPVPASPSGVNLGSIGLATVSYTFASPGTYTARMRCWDWSGVFVLTSESSVVQVASVGGSAAAGASVGAISPTTATAGVAVELLATYAGFEAGVNACSLVINDVYAGAMDLTTDVLSASGTAKKTYAFPAEGTYGVRATCGVPDGYAYGPLTTVTVSAAAGTGSTSTSSADDTVAPTVGSVSPTTATVGISTTFSASYSDAGSGVQSCSLVVDGQPVSVTVSLSGNGASGTASATYQPVSAGTLAVQITCIDVAGKTGMSATQNVTVGGASAGADDTTSPAMGAITPTAATANTAVTFSATYTDTGSGVTACYLIINGGTPSAMTRTGNGASGTASKVYTFTAAGSATVAMQCVDAAGNTKTAGPMALTVSAATSASDTALPVIGSVTPIAATVNEAVTLSATYTDAVGVTACYLYVDGVSAGATSRSTSATSGTASMSHTFTTSGAHSARIECVDAAGNRGVGLSATVTVAPALSAGPDVSLPVVGLVSPSTAVANILTTFAATFADNVGVTACYLYADNVGVGAMTRSTGTASTGVMSASHRFTTNGSHSIRVECVDAAGNRGVGGTSTVAVGAVAVADTSVPVVSSLVRPMAIVAGTSNRYTVFITDTSAISSCRLSANGSVVATMSVTNSAGQTNATAAADYAFPSSGTYALRVECTDAAGNRGVSPSEAMSVTAASVSTVPAANPSALRISAVTPGAVGTGAATSYSIAYTSGPGVISCSLYLNGTYLGSMGLSGPSTNGQANYLHTFTAPGTYRLHAECIDDARVRGIGPNTNVTVSVDGTVPAGSSAAVSQPLPGSLIKLICPEGAAGDHPCKAVYYYGFDGMRHAFPHERVFFTWFNNFDNVVEVTNEAMSSIRLGRTVTYRPGVRLLKFRTVPRVYALTRGGVLRWVTSESAAATLYGADWAQRVDDIQDAFYTDYTFGNNIDSASDYNAESERNTVTTIDANR